MIVSGAYPFIDIAVLDGVRERFARGDALVVISQDLETVIWANGPGAAIFGFDAIDGMVGTTGLQIQARRQLKALDGFPSLGKGKALSARIASGVHSRLVNFTASEIELPDGHYAVLLAVAGNDASAATAVTGLNDETTHAAVLDAEGSIQAASERFSTLGFDTITLRQLIEEVRSEGDRLVKRPVHTASGIVPTGIARLTDEPAIHLLFAVSDVQSIGEEAPAAAAPAPDVAVRSADVLSAPVLPEIEEPAAQEQETTEAEPVAIMAKQQEDAGPSPVRFLWRVDADTAFTEISPEFANAVGAPSADVIGRRFADVARVYGMDPNREIAELLEQRGTWSGRTIFWPIAGTDQRTPVELAALPIYSRERVFQGFRGFGIARTTDAINDPEAIGLVLVSPVVPEAELETVVAEPVAPEQTVDAPTDMSVAPRDDNAPAAQPEPKVVHLGGRAAREDNRLSPVERNAFREIAERLRRSGLARPADESEPASTVDAMPSAEDHATAEPSSSALPVTDEAIHVPDPVPVAEAEAVESPQSSDDNQPPAPTEPAIPSAFAVQDSKATGRVDTSMLTQLPLPLLVHRNDAILYANRALLDLTGYASIKAITEAGGLDALIAERTSDTASDDPACSTLLHADGSSSLARAHLQAVPWDDERALLLAFSPVEDAAPVAIQPEAEPAHPRPAAANDQPSDEDVAILKTRIDELTSILDTATDGIVLLSHDGSIRSINNSASALFGYEPEDVEGKPFSTLFAIESQRAAMDYINSLSDNGVASLLNDGREVIGREEQGRFIPLFMTIGKLPKSNGYCAVIRDITTWKRAEEELVSARREAERTSNQKTEFLARISHEVRTPLNAIIGFSELMSDEKFGPIGNERYRDYLRDINRSGQHVLDLINDLLDISKIEAGAFEMDFEAVSLNDALAEAVAIMQPQANRERVIIRSSFNSNLPDIVADTRSIKQIGLNLLSNAVRFTGPGGQVIISTTYEASGDVILRVRDTGIGMTPQEIEQALKPYKQISSMRRGRGDGTGLGLPLTKAMAEANRANFRIDSAPGRGTIVEIAFPSTRVLAD